MRQLETLRGLMATMPESAQQHLRATMPQLSAERKLQIKQLLADADRAGHD